MPILLLRKIRNKGIKAEEGNIWKYPNGERRFQTGVTPSIGKSQNVQRRWGNASFASTPLQRHRSPSGLDSADPSFLCPLLLWKSVPVSELYITSCSTASSPRCQCIILWEQGFSLLFVQPTAESVPFTLRDGLRLNKTKQQAAAKKAKSGNGNRSPEEAHTKQRLKQGVPLPYIADGRLTKS